MPIYVASGRRDTTPEQEIDYLKDLMSRDGAKAVKYRVGRANESQRRRLAGTNRIADSAVS